MGYQRNYRAITSERPYWQNDYNDVTALLHEKLQNFIRLNARLRENIDRKSKFLQIRNSEIYINLNELKPQYQFKFIIVDFQKYCDNFIAVLEPVFASFLSEIQHDAHSFIFKFSLGPDNCVKYKTIMAARP
ncbi:hypothetical protein [Pedobacter africanus]|uniref:Uncharacterized protein n=1 Tax=Pedobacter africanus TaxID=151894 RepID=A0A1W1Z766_9SPHI|nr:hypothetical protein [Pedobacter africanus]SMC44253.1 hypothetical protein SAMN04488524_0432 [Pedobacter africanus]